MSISVALTRTGHYELMKRDDGAFLIRSPYDDKPEYFVGFDWKKAQFLNKRMNESHRPNVEVREDGLYVCFNFHARCDTCDYEKVAEAEKK